MYISCYDYHIINDIIDLIEHIFEHIRNAMKFEKIILSSSRTIQTISLENECYITACINYLI